MQPPSAMRKTVVPSSPVTAVVPFLKEGRHGFRLDEGEGSGGLFFAGEEDTEMVAAIDIAGMAVAFPIGIGLALVIGVGVSYYNERGGNPWILLIGVVCIVVAIVLNSVAYRRLSSDTKTTGKGIALSVICGVLMGFFYRFVADSMAPDFAQPTSGLLTPYAALFIFSIGIFISNFLFNSIVMYKPVTGPKTNYLAYFKEGNIKLHLIGILGGVIWGIGMSFSIMASVEAGYAISYGLGQGATMVAALWGVLVWKEFAGAPKSVNRLLILMFTLFVIGLVLIIISRLSTS